MMGNEKSSIEKQNTELDQTICHDEKKGGSIFNLYQTK